MHLVQRKDVPIKNYSRCVKVLQEENAVFPAFSQKYFSAEIAALLLKVALSAVHRIQFHTLTTDLSER